MISQNLILRYINGHTSEEETKEVVEWIKASEKNKRSYMNIRRMNDLLIWNSDTKSNDIDSFSVSKSTTFSKVFKFAVGVAAVFIALFVSHSLYTKYNQGHTDIMQVLVAPPGQRAEMVLVDGTKVWLNAGSTLRFPSQFADIRCIELKGEAFFDVVKDAEKPFIVETDEHQVRVHGTSFNVSAYQSSPFEVSLLQGSVSVYSKQTHQTLILKPGEKICDFNEKHFYKEIIPNDDAFLWKQGIISFHDESVEDIFRRLESFYDIKIINKNKQLLEKHYTGKFKMKDGIEQILKVLKYSSDFQYYYNMEDNEIIIM